MRASECVCVSKQANEWVSVYGNQKVQRQLREKKNWVCHFELANGFAGVSFLTPTCITVIIINCSQHNDTHKTPSVNGNRSAQLRLQWGMRVRAITVGATLRSAVSRCCRILLASGQRRAVSRTPPPEFRHVILRRSSKGNKWQLLREVHSLSSFYMNSTQT